MQRRVSLLCILLVLCTTIQGQDRSQEAKSKWVAEAHKVYAAFYQPLQLEKIGCRSEDKETYICRFLPIRLRGR